MNHSKTNELNLKHMLCQGYDQFSTDRDFYEDVPKSDFATFISQRMQHQDGMK